MKSNSYQSEVGTLFTAFPIGGKPHVKYLHNNENFIIISAQKKVVAREMLWERSFAQMSALFVFKFIIDRKFK